jgi:hypothetical protein
MLAAMPIVMAIIAAIFWSSYRACKRSKESIMGNLMATLVILLFLIHPSIVQYMFQNFDCFALDTDKRLYSDL